MWPLEFKSPSNTLKVDQMITGSTRPWTDVSESKPICFPLLHSAANQGMGDNMMHSQNSKIPMGLNSPAKQKVP